MKKQKLALVLASILMLSTVLTGCKSDNGATTAPTAQPTEGSSAPTEAAAPTSGEEAVAPTSGEEAAVKQEITFALQNEPDGIDPSVTNNSFAGPILNNVFEGLVTYDTTDGSMVPGDAESWDISADGTVYTFHLRSGLKWSNGDPLTAKDYLYTFKRILTPDTVAQYVAMASDYIVNAQAFYDGEVDFAEVGVKALDDTTLEITLTDATPFYLDILTMWTFSPIHEATITANGDKWTTSADTYVCNGPFYLTSIKMGEGYTLEKNPNYHDADIVKLQKINYRFVPDPSTALSAYETGEIDGSRVIPPADIARLTADDAGVVVAPSFATTYFDINCAKAPFDNILVRKAINLAIDRDAIINDVLQNGGSPAYSIVSPGYVIDGKDFTEGRGTFGLGPKADPEAAKATLAEAGYPDGAGFPTVTVSYYTSETAKMMAEAVAEMLKTNLGINVEITSEEWAVYYEGIKLGNYDIAAMGWGGDYVHPMTFLPLQKTGDPNNQLFYSNPEYDALVQQAKVETDPVKAVEIMKQAEAVAANEYPLLSLFFRTNKILINSKITGFYLNPSDNLYFKTAVVN